MEGNRRKDRERAATYGEFLQCFPCCTEERQRELTAILKAQERPDRLGGREVMKDLNLISYGSLDSLSRLAGKKDADPAAETVNILLGIPQEEVYGLDVNRVFGFLNFVEREVRRINGLFDGIRVTHTAEELAAGIENVSFGPFGVLDWYARRMGISNQSEVYGIAWARIYRCMEIDNTAETYRRRLQKVCENRMKRHGR